MFKILSGLSHKKSNHDKDEEHCSECSSGGKPTLTRVVARFVPHQQDLSCDNKENKEKAKFKRMTKLRSRIKLSFLLDRLQSTLRANKKKKKNSFASGDANERHAGINCNYEDFDDDDDKEGEEEEEDEDDDDDDAYESAEEFVSCCHNRDSYNNSGDNFSIVKEPHATQSKTSNCTRHPTGGSMAGPIEQQIDRRRTSKLDEILPEEDCDIPTFLNTKNCDRYLIDETRRLLKERYAKNPDSFYDNDYKRMLTDDWTVSRFLLRRREDPKRTAKLMEECGRFRKTYKMSEVQLWEFPVEFHKAGGLFKYGPDRVGNVTLYMRVKMYRRVPEISDVFKAFILCVLEECDMANNGRGTAVIFDLSGCSLQNVDLGFLSWLLSSFRNYCPKGVSYILVYNLPWILNATCKLAMTWMSASNKRALRFVHGDEIENFIAKENLPDYLGGTCKLNYRAVPDGSKPAIDVCDRLDMTREQALKIKELFKEYLDEDDEEVGANGVKNQDSIGKKSGAKHPNTSYVKSEHVREEHLAPNGITTNLGNNLHNNTQNMSHDTSFDLSTAHGRETSDLSEISTTPVVDIVSQASKFITH